MKISIEEYHKNEAISNSDLSLINKSINHYLRKQEEEEKEENSSLILGQAFHDLILSKEIVSDRYILMPEEIKQKRGKAWEEFKEIAGDKIVLTKAQTDVLDAMEESFLSHPKAKLLIGEGYAEESFFYRVGGIQCKCRPDFVNTKHNLIVDLKTSRSALPDDFSRSIANYRYHVQAAWYLDGVNRVYEEEEKEERFDKFIFIVVETASPFSVCVYELGTESIEEGRRQYKKDLDKFIEYKMNSHDEKFFKGISSDIITLQLPNWAFYKNIELN